MLQKFAQTYSIINVILFVAANLVELRGGVI